jgi:RNA polymerase sigma-70 factor (ECF subfamily)
MIEEMSIQEVLRKIPPEQRVCLVLHYVEGFKYREIADTLGISEEAVQKRVSRGKHLFRQLYEGGTNK